jgi:hypothetical protein
MPWWRTQEKVAWLFETLLKPFEAKILHDTKQRDIANVYRQLDVGVIDDQTGEKRVKSFVEVQKRKSPVTIQNLGDWEYKRSTLGASEFTIISEAGFTSSVIKHVKRFHSETIRLGRLYPAEKGHIEKFDATILGVDRVLDLWWFVAIMVQYADKDEIVTLPHQSYSDTEAKIFGGTSPMDLVRFAEASSAQGGLASGQFHARIFDVLGHQMTYDNRALKRVILVAEKKRRIWEPKTQFFTYCGVFPEKGQKGIALISDFKVDADRDGRLILVLLPDPDNVGGGNIKLAGQLHLI